MELGTRPSHSKTMYDYKPCGRFVETIFPVVSIFRDYSFRTCGNIQNSQHEAELVGMGSNPRSANYTTAIETGLSAKHLTYPRITDLPSVMPMPMVIVATIFFHGKDFQLLNICVYRQVRSLSSFLMGVCSFL
jgi:hypothetical protein